MKKKSVVLARSSLSTLAVALAIVTLSPLVYSQGYTPPTTTNYMDSSGHVVGSSVNYGNGTVQYRDVNGSIVGSSYNGNGASNTTNYMDSSGHVIGSSYSSSPNNNPQPIRPLDRDSWQAK